jgi:hypothetical protein
MVYVGLLRARSEDFVQIHNKLTDVNIGCEDTPICNCAKNEKHTCS